MHKISDEVKVNFLPETEQQKNIKLEKKERPKLGLKRIFVGLVVVFIVFFVVFSSSMVFSNENLIKRLGMISQVGQLIANADKPLAGESDDRINFVLIGIGGRDHDGGTLADTLIVASIKPSTKQAAIMSIPRDTYVKHDKFGWVKINAVSAYAERDQDGSSGPAMSEFLSQMLGIPIQYYAVVDFDGFEKVIDEFGGVDIVVDNDLIDYQYPIRGREDAYPISSRFEKLVIKQGQQHLDGATALKYARSRHALGPEGSDFARSRRQQKVIIALKEKILQANNLLNPNKIGSLFNAYKENISTNLQIWEMAKLGNMAKDFDTSNLLSLKVNDAADSFLRSSKINGAYVLLPKDGSYDKIKYAWQNIFNPEFSSSTLASYTVKYNTDFAALEKMAQEQEAARLAAEASSTASSTASTTEAASSTPATTTADDLFADEETTDKPAAKTFKDEKASIEILNGSEVNGWAGSEKTKLSGLGFTVAGAGNAPTSDYTAVKIYDLSGGKNPLTLAELKKTYGVSASKSLPSGIESNADFLVILGKK